MKTIFRILTISVGAIAILGSSLHASASGNVTSRKRLLPTVVADSARIHELYEKRVIVKDDTVGIILPAKNYGRYDRGLYNFLFIPKGQWAFGLTASYGSFDSKDVELLNIIRDFDFNGKKYSIKPSVSYFIKSNSCLGIKLAYTKGDATLGSIKADIMDDLSLDISRVGYSMQQYNIGVFYRNYVGLGPSKRFAIFNEVDLSFGSGNNRFTRYYDGELRDTRTNITKASLNFSPGVCVFLMDYVSFNVSFGVFGLHLTSEKQKTNGYPDGSRTSSGANFRFNIFNINFGIGVHI